MSGSTMRSSCRLRCLRFSSSASELGRGSEDGDEDGDGDGDNVEEDNDGRGDGASQTMYVGASSQYSEDVSDG